MSVWCLLTEQRPQMMRCEICGREIEQLHRLHQLTRICRSCLVREAENRAA